MVTEYVYNEKELIRLIAEGNEQAFGEVVRNYTALIYHHLASQLHDHQLAQELTQNIFISLWQKREKLPEIENFPGYIYVMARNNAYKSFIHLTARAETESIPDDLLHTLLESPPATLELNELKAVINRGIAALPNRRREVFELSRMDDLSYEAIATKLRISKSAVKQHIIAARVFLRAYLKNHAEIMISWFLLLQSLF